MGSGRFLVGFCRNSGRILDGFLRLRQDSGRILVEFWNDSSERFWSDSGDRFCQNSNGILVAFWLDPGKILEGLWADSG